LRVALRRISLTYSIPGSLFGAEPHIDRVIRRHLDLAVIDGPHGLAFPCQRILGSWINAETKEQIGVRPTHWREWQRPS